jgi:two-component sensor histidine kinase
VSAALPANQVSTAVDFMLPATLTAASVAGWLWDPVNAQVTLTNAASTVLGLLPDQSRTLPSLDFDLIHPSDRAARGATLEAATSAVQGFRNEFRIIRPCDRQVAWIEERGHAVRDPHSHEIVLTALLWEISDRKRSVSTDTRDVGVNRYAHALDLETVGIAFFGADERLTEANDAYLRMCGIERADLSAGTVRWGDGTAPEWLTLTHRAMDEFRRTGRVVPHEKECVRPDGHRWWGLFGARRLSEREGLEYIIDVSAAMQAEHNLRDSERRMRSLIEGIPQIVWRSLDQGRWTWASPQWTDTTGQPQSQSLDFGWVDMVHPEDRESALASWNRAGWQQTLVGTCRLWNIGTHQYRTFQFRATAVRDEARHTLEWIGSCTDIEDLQQLHTRQRLLVAELQHRTRNLLALVRTIARQTIGGHSEERLELLGDFDERLSALSRAQGLITRADGERVDLEGLLRAELAAVRGTAPGRVAMQGPRVDLTPSHAQTMALATHELATNALKYGALGVAGGELLISWRTSSDTHEGEVLHFSWKESGVPLIDTAEIRYGFGRELLENALPFSLSARTALRFESDGVDYTIELPLARSHRESAHL